MRYNGRLLLLNLVGLVVLGVVVPVAGGVSAIVCGVLFMVLNGGSVMFIAWRSGGCRSC